MIFPAEEAHSDRTLKRTKTRLWRTFAQSVGGGQTPPPGTQHFQVVQGDDLPHSFFNNNCGLFCLRSIWPRFPAPQKTKTCATARRVCCSASPVLAQQRFCASCNRRRRPRTIPCTGCASACSAALLAILAHPAPATAAAVRGIPAAELLQCTAHRHQLTHRLGTGSHLAYHPARATPGNAWAALAGAQAMPGRCLRSPEFAACGMVLMMIMHCRCRKGAASGQCHARHTG